MTVVCYPTPGKEKARAVCRAFADGCGGLVADRIPDALLQGPAMFYGVTPATAHLWRQARDEGREFYYADNSYFDATREKYFRVTRNRLQHDGFGQSDCRRFDALGLSLEPWRDPRGTDHVLVCPQSDEFMHVVVGMDGWLQDTLADLAGVTQRRVIVREWSRNKGHQASTFADALAGCWCVVTWSSAAAVAAILRGVPAICLAPDCAARPVAGHFLDEIDSPPTNICRRTWAGVLADNQWSLDEFRTGKCWADLRAGTARAVA